MGLDYSLLKKMEKAEKRDLREKKRLDKKLKFNKHDVIDHGDEPQVDEFDDTVYQMTELMSESDLINQSISSQVTKVHFREKMARLVKDNQDDAVLGHPGESVYLSW